MAPQSVFPGHRYGRLMVLREAGRRRGHRVFVCRCDCGAEKEIVADALRRGDAQSCGCLGRERRLSANLKHGHANRTGTYKSWEAMCERCSNPNHTGYPRYGGRGVKVCARWREPDGQGFVNFLADMGERPASRTIDRTDNDGDYTPENCRWATRSEQNRRH